MAVIDHEHSDIEYINTAIHTFVSQYLSETGGFSVLIKPLRFERTHCRHKLARTLGSHSRT